MKWPDAFYPMLRGVGCPMCQEGRPGETVSGVRFYAGTLADAYLNRADIQRGLSVVIWRGRHVAEPTELSREEAARYWYEVLTVGRALQEVLRPVKLNYNILGNSVPHLHTHVVPRYANDPRPGWPFPFPEGEATPMAADALAKDVEGLRSAIESGRDDAFLPSG